MRVDARMLVDRVERGLNGIEVAGSFGGGPAQQRAHGLSVGL